MTATDAPSTKHVLITAGRCDPPPLPPASSDTVLRSTEELGVRTQAFCTGAHLVRQSTSPLGRRSLSEVSGRQKRGSSL